MSPIAKLYLVYLCTMYIFKLPYWIFICQTNYRMCISLYTRISPLIPSARRPRQKPRAAGSYIRSRIGTNPMGMGHVLSSKNRGKLAGQLRVDLIVVCVCY